MKKLAFIFLGVSSTLLGQAVDEELFLKPVLSQFAGKVAFDAGQSLSSDKKHSFEHALSVNIGKNIPPTTHFVSTEECKVLGLGAHLRNIADSLKAKGKAIIIAPASYGVVFTNGKASEKEVRHHIETVITKIGTSQDQNTIASCFNELKEVEHATFVRRDNKFKLVTEEKALPIGEIVLRKTPEGIETNIYHSEEEYLVAIKNAGLICEEIKRPCFFGEVKWKAYNEKANDKVLGRAYINHHPYTIFMVTKG